MKQLLLMSLIITLGTIKPMHETTQNLLLNDWNKDELCTENQKIVRDFKIKSNQLEKAKNLRSDLNTIFFWIPELDKSIFMQTYYETVQFKNVNKAGTCNICGKEDLYQQNERTSHKMNDHMIPFLLKIQKPTANKKIISLNKKPLIKTMIKKAENYHNNLITSSLKGTIEDNLNRSFWY